MTVENTGRTVDTADTEDTADTVRVRLDVAYDGTDFHGWARQKGPQEGLRTVQGVLEEKLSLVFRTPVEQIGRAHV